MSGGLQWVAAILDCKLDNPRNVNWLSGARKRNDHLTWSCFLDCFWLYYYRLTLTSVSEFKQRKNFSLFESECC